MNAPGRLRWIGPLLLVGGVYLLAGIVFGALAGQASSNEMRTAWRLAAWVVSAVAFAAHIAYEQIRLRSSPRTTALHAALACAVGAFGLAVAANLHQHPSATQHRLTLALAIWPLLTALPAFVAALITAALLSWARRTVDESSAVKRN